MTVPRLAPALLFATFLLAPAAGAQIRQISCDTGLGQTGPFEPSCREEGAGFGLRDPEFDHARFLVTWAETLDLGTGPATFDESAVFVAPVDPVTGEIRAEAADSVTARFAPAGLVGNGPEWADSARGPEIFHTCITADLSTVEICRIAPGAGGLGVEVLANSRGLAANNPSKNPGLAAPRIFYLEFEGDLLTGLDRAGVGWRVDDGAGDNAALPLDFGPGVWLPDGRRLIHVDFEVGLEGIFRRAAGYDTRIGRGRLLIDDAIDRSFAIAWNAPELGGALAFVALAENPATGTVDIETYRQQGAAWVLWNRIDPVCPAYPNGWSPEPFIFQGRSYLSKVWLAGTDFLNDPAVISVASADPDHPAPVNRLISGPACDADTDQRRDPEALVLFEETGARLYFSEETRP